MASTDARPIPLRNLAYRITFPILDAAGDLVAGATGLDSEVSKDGGTFADCTNEATEIGTASGVYYLDLTTTEMNADTVAVIVKTTTSGAKTTTLIFYPLEGSDLKVSVTHWADTVVAVTSVPGVPKVDTSYINGGAITATLDQIKTDTAAIHDDTNDLQTRLPTALTAGGTMKSDLVTLGGDADTAYRLYRSLRGIIYGTVGSGSTTTSVVCSTLSPSPTVAQQFTWRFLIFDMATTTPALRGQATDITSMTTTTFAVSPLSIAPVSGDTFVVC